MAFQIADDILDYVGEEEVTGKPAGLDLREHKVTLPLIGALRRMSPAGAAKIRRLFEVAEPGNAEIAEAIALVGENGGIEYARAKALEYADAARGELLLLPPSPARESLSEAVAYSVNRAPLTAPRSRIPRLRLYWRTSRHSGPRVGYWSEHIAGGGHPHSALAGKEVETCHSD